MNIDHFEVYMTSKEINIQTGIVAEVSIFFSKEFALKGFKYTSSGWVIPKYYSYLSGEQTPYLILNNSFKTFLTTQLTNAMTSVKLVLTVESFEKIYTVNQMGATLMAQ